MNEVKKQLLTISNNFDISNRKLRVLLIVYLTIYGIREIVGISVPDSVFSLYCLFSFVVLNSEQSFCFYMATIITTIPFLEVRIAYITLSLLKMLFIKKRIKLEVKAFILIMAMLVLQLVDILVYSKDSLRTTMYDYLNVITVFIVPLLWSTLHLKKSHIIVAAKCFICGCILSAVSLIWQSISLYGISYVISGSNRLGMDLNLGKNNMTTSLNTNTLAELMVSVIIIGFILYRGKEIKTFTVSTLFLFGVLTILLTQSRGGLLCLTLFLIYYILFCINGRMAILKRIGMIIFIIIVALFVIVKLPDLQNEILNRIYYQTDLSNGRLELNADCLHAWSANVYTIIFGYGARNYMSAASGLRNSAHNMFVDILVSWGITGLILISGWVIFLIKKYIAGISRPNKKIAYVPLVMYLTSLQDGQFLNVEIPFIMISFFAILGSIFNDSNDRLR